MRYKSGFQRLNTFLLSESWTDTFITWLHKIHQPYWSTCTLIGLMYFFIFFLNGWRSPSDGINFLLSFIYSFSLSYGFYILWRLENNIKTLFRDFDIFKQEKITPEIPVVKSRWQITIVACLRILYNLCILIFLIAGWIYSGYILQVLSVAWVFIILNLVFAVTIKIVKIISIIYGLRSQSIEINLWDLSSLYQLSELTQRTVFYLLPLSVVLAPFSLMLSIFFYRGGGFTLSGWQINAIPLVINFIFAGLGPALIIFSFFIFILPVFWIREKIIETKSKLLSETGIRLKNIFQQQDLYAEHGEFAKIGEMKEYTQALIVRKEYLEKISEWPWEGRVFREFSAAILIPLFLWLAQFFINRWLER